MKRIIIFLSLLLISIGVFVTSVKSDTITNIFLTSLSKEVTVYITATGKCYHYKKSCAGSNAIETTLDKCNNYKPCKKCVK